MKERTFVIFKPDSLEKKLLPELLKRLQDAGLEIVALKMEKLKESVLKEHYAHIFGKPYYQPLVDFMTRRSVIMAILEGDNAVAKVRSILGATNPENAEKGTIRADYADNTRENIMHASDSLETAKTEIARFFKSEEIF